MSRAVRAALIGVALAFAFSSAAYADPAGPTDFRTEIVDVTPETALDAVTFSVVGGDAFIEVEVEPGHELVVLGYHDEPYLRIRDDGVVEHNVYSYATYYNEDRYGDVDIPDIVDNTAEPEWERIGDGGSWAWHDHRAHWMGDEPPIGLDPGESLPSETIPMLVNGASVEVDVVTTLLPSAPIWPAAFGVLIGLQLGLVGMWLGRATTVFVAIVLAVAALVAGLAQFWSLPASTGPLLTWWLIPAVALVLALAPIAIYGRSVWVETGLVMIAAAQLTLWAWARRGHTTAAIVPTDLPASLDRAITTAVLAGGIVTLIATVRGLRRTVSSNPPRRSPD